MIIIIITVVCARFGSRDSGSRNSVQRLGGHHAVPDRAEIAHAHQKSWWITV